MTCDSRNVMRTQCRNKCRDGLIPAGQDEVRADVSERAKNKWALVETRVRESELRKGEMQIVVVKNIEVDGAGSMMGMPARAAHQFFDTLQAMKQVKRRQGATDFDNGIQKQR